MNSSTEVEAIVRRQALAWETQDLPALVADFAQDAVFLAGGLTFQGVGAIEQAAADYFRQFTDTKVEIKRIIIGDRQGAVEWHWQDRNRKTGKSSVAEDAIVFELQENGKIVYWREYIEQNKD